MSKQDILRKIQSLRDSIDDHQDKINDAQRHHGSPYDIKYWEREIRNMQSEIANLEAELNQEAKEVYCETCRRYVIPKSNLCPRCDAYLG